jgi:hypothetical protein
MKWSELSKNQKYGWMITGLAAMGATYYAYQKGYFDKEDKQGKFPKTEVKIKKG